MFEEGKTCEMRGHQPEGGMEQGILRSRYRRRVYDLFSFWKLFLSTGYRFVRIIWKLFAIL